MKPKLGSGGRFAQLKTKLAHKGASNPAALAAYIGQKKYGAHKMAQLSAHGRKSEHGFFGHYAPSQYAQRPIENTAGVYGHAMHHAETSHHQAMAAHHKNLQKHHSMMAQNHKAMKGTSGHMSHEGHMASGDRGRVAGTGHHSLGHSEKAEHALSGNMAHGASLKQGRGY